LSIPEIDFKSRLELFDKFIDENILFLLGTYGRFEKIVPENPFLQNQNLPEKILEIINPTKGYLLFKEQGIELYSQIKGINPGEALNWVENWNKKEQTTREKTHIIKVTDGEEVNLNSLFVPHEMGCFFLNKPTSETFLLLSELTPSYQDRIKTEGYFQVSFNGDLFYDEVKEKEIINGKAELIETKNGLIRIRLRVEFSTLKIQEIWEFGLNHKYQGYSWIDFTGLEIIELDEGDYFIQLYPYRKVLGQDIYDDFSLKIRFDKASKFNLLTNCDQNQVFDLKTKMNQIE
jgi:hypothetical protein